MEQTAILEVVSEYVAETFLDGDSVDLDAASPLLEWGILDSMAMVSLVSFLEDRFAIRIGEDAITPQNFRNLSAISALVEAHTSRPPAVDLGGEAPEQDEELSALLEYGATRERVALDSGAQVHAVRMPGEGPTWVLLPELGQSSSHFAPLQRTLESFHESLAVDLAGFGLSRCPNPAPSVWDHVALISEVISKQEKAPVVLVAHGPTALAASELARRHPERVRALVVVAFGEGQDISGFIDSLVALADRAEELLSATYYTQPRLSARQKEAWLARLRAPAMRAFVDQDAEELAPRMYRELTVPVLFVCGQDDRLVPRESVERAAELLRGAELKWLARAGHAVARERPDEIVSLIETFLSGL